MACLLLSLLNYRIKLYKTPSWFNGTLLENHSALLHFNYTNNEQSRLLQFYIPELFHILLKIDIVYCYTIQRVLFITLALFVFYKFSQIWLNLIQSFLCVLIMALIMPMSYKNHLQESFSLLLFLFILVFYNIRNKNDLTYSILLFIGAFNNETILYTPLIYFLYNYCSTNKPLYLLKKTFLLSFPGYLAFGFIRYLTKDQPHLGGAWHFEENLYNLHQPFLLFNVLWIIPFLFFKELPVFFKSALISIPFFIAPHLITGIISETRQMIPMGFILIPSTIMFFDHLRSDVKLMR